MKNEVIFTVSYNNSSMDIAVSSDILIADLVEIVMQHFGGNDFTGRLFSINHDRILLSENTLYDEKIWDGDILNIVK